MPFAVVSSGVPFFPGEFRGDDFAGVGGAPDRDGLLLLEDGVGREQRIQFHVRARDGGEDEQGCGDEAKSAGNHGGD